MPLARSHSLLRSLVLAAAYAALATAARAQDTTYREGVRLGITYTPGTKPGIIVLPVAGGDGDSVRAILQRDFSNGDRINVVALDASALPESTDGRTALNYPLYARLGAAALLQVTQTSYGVHIAVHNVAKGQVERARDFTLVQPVLAANGRLSLHEVADDIEQWITGVRGISATRILYEGGRRIWQVDADGVDPVVVGGNGTTIVLGPVWHPKGTHIAYATLANGASWQIILREAGGATRVLGTTPGGLNSTPAFSPDGFTLVYSHGAEAGTDLYATNAFASEPARRITVGRGTTNTSPSFSPDGRRIAFTSDRLGHPEVYISDADGTNAELLAPYNFGDQLYRANPDWSPDGRLIAFEAQIDGRMQIMIVGLRDRMAKRLTNEGINEQPSWAPDSRHLVFTSTRGGTKQLWILDIEAGTFRQLTHAPGSARLGAWSPPLRSR